MRTSQRSSTLLSVAFARASATGLPSPASFSHSHNKWRGSSDLMSETGCKSDLFFRGMRARELSHLHDEVALGDDAEGDAGEPVDGGGRHQHREPRLQEQRRRRGSPGGA